jgi:hypothetical protein
MKSLITVIVFVGVLAFTVPASAIFGLPETLEGSIESVNESTLAILSEKGNMQEVVEFQINDETEFDETASLDNLEPGDQVKVRYKEEGNEKVAISIAKVATDEMTDQEAPMSPEEPQPEPSERL